MRRMGSEKLRQDNLLILRGEGGPAVCRGRWGALQPQGNPSRGGSSPHRARGPFVDATTWKFDSFSSHGLGAPGTVLG